MQCLPQVVDNLAIDNLLIDTERDGLDIDCCRNVRISNCTVNSPWDDAICPKSSFALGDLRSTDNLTIANCFVTGAYELGSVIAGAWRKLVSANPVRRNGRIKCGTESNGGFRNITISNCVLEGSDGIALEAADGATVEDIAISNITMRDTSDAPLFLRLSRRNRGPSQQMRPGTLRRVVITNMVSYGSTPFKSSMIAGIESNLIQDVKINNCYFGTSELSLADSSGTNEKLYTDWKDTHVPQLEDAYPDLSRFGPMPTNGFFLRHLRNVEMAHVEIESAGPDQTSGLLAGKRSSRGFLCNNRATEAELRASQRHRHACVVVPRHRRCQHHSYFQRNPLNQRFPLTPSSAN